MASSFHDMRDSRFAQAHGKGRKLPDGYSHPQRQLLTEMSFKERRKILQVFYWAR